MSSRTVIYKLQRTIQQRKTTRITIQRISKYKNQLDIAIPMKYKFVYF